MPAVKLERKIREAGPSIGRWLILSFVLACAYWIACLHWLGADVFAQIALSPNFVPPQYYIFHLIPLSVSLGLAFPFRLTEPRVGQWIWLIAGASLLSELAFLVVLISN